MYWSTNNLLAFFFLLFRERKTKECPRHFTCSWCKCSMSGGRCDQGNVDRLTQSLSSYHLQTHPNTLLVFLGSQVIGKVFVMSQTCHIHWRSCRGEKATKRSGLYAIYSHLLPYLHVWKQTLHIVGFIYLSVTVHDTAIWHTIGALSYNSHEAALGLKWHWSYITLGQRVLSSITLYVPVCPSKRFN